MKNRFGFIPIVLPVIVMVLIIGLINLGEAQRAQAHDDATSHTHSIGPNDQQLTDLRVDGCSSLSPAFDGTQASYECVVEYAVSTGTITADGATSISPDDDTSSAGSANVALTAGQTKTVTIKVDAAGATNSASTYTLKIKREMPQLTGLALANGSVINNNTRNFAPPEGVLNDGTGNVFGSATTTYTSFVAFDVDTTTVTVNLSASARGEQGGIGSDDIVAVSATMNGSSQTARHPDNNYVYDVRPNVGMNTLKVRAFGSSTQSHYTDYTLRLNRQNPMLNGLALAAANGTPIPAGDNQYGVLNDGHGNAYVAPTATTTYSANVEYDRDMIRVRPTVSANQAAKGARWKVVSPSKDQNPDTGDYEVKLNPGKNVIKVRAENSNNIRQYTEYTINVTREMTQLSTISLTSPEVSLPGISTPVVTTTWSGEVNYENLSVVVAATAPDGVEIELRQEGTFVATTTGSTAFPMQKRTRPLKVGNNQFTLKASSNGNSNTYTINIERKQPEPTLRFTLKDSDGAIISTGDHPLKLDAQSRTYDLADRVDEITSDDLLVAASVELQVQALLPLTGLNAPSPSRSGVSVSINGVTVPVAGTNNNNISVALSEGPNTLAFDVNYETGDSSDPEDISTHRVVIERKGNAVPRFPTNDPIEGRTITVVRNTTITPTQELPYATGGNGDLIYTLEGDEALGTARSLPASLYTLPSGTTKGRLNTAPPLIGTGDVSYYYLVLKVVDSDAVEVDDEDTLRFTIKVVRDTTLLPDDTTTPRAKGDLIDLRVMYVNSTTAKHIMKPEFIGTTYSYIVEVPTDVDRADVEVVAATGATVTLQGTQTSVRNGPGCPTVEGGTCHEWNAFQIYRGSAATVRNVYDVVVTENGTSKTYRLTVIRTADDAPEFADGSKMTFEYYDDIPLADLSKSKRELRSATSGNGSLSYTFERRAALAPGDADDFLGLTADVDSTPPALTGTPSVDTSIARNADRSEVLARLTVSDADANKADSDKDTVDVDIIVYRNVAIETYEVNGVTKDNLDTSTREYRATRSYRWDDADIKEYTFNVPHDATRVTFEANPYDTARASVSYLPVDADPSTAVHDVNVGSGDNEVTVTVSNGGAISAVHVINLRKPGLQLLGIDITEDEDARDNSALSADVKLSPDFDREKTSYTASVENWVRSVQVKATPSDPTATVFVNDFKVADPPGYSVVDLAIGENTITLGASVGDKVADTLYTVTLTREADTAPSFGDSAVDDITRLVDADVDQHPLRPDSSARRRQRHGQRYAELRDRRRTASSGTHVRRLEAEDKRHAHA